MAISFPRDLPDPHRLRDAVFTPDHGQTTQPTRGGLVQVANLRPALWRMSFSTVALDQTQAGVWQAWIDSLRGGLNRFKAWDTRQRFSLAHPDGWGNLTRAGGGAFDGTATLSAGDAGASTIVVTDLPDSFIFLPGDYLSFAGAAAHALHRVVEAVTADGAGAVTLPIEPPLKPGFQTGALEIEKAYCEAVIDETTLSETQPSPFTVQISFQAVQAIK